MNKIKTNKKGVEMSLNMLVAIIIAIIALAIIVSLFSGGYTENSDKAGTLAGNAIDIAKNYSTK